MFLRLGILHWSVRLSTLPSRLILHSPAVTRSVHEAGVHLKVQFMMTVAAVHHHQAANQLTFILLLVCGVSEEPERLVCSCS